MSDLVKYTTLAASAAVLAEGGTLCGLVLTSGSDAATVTIYDNATTNSGTVVCGLAAPAASTSVVYTPDYAMSVRSGIYALITGTTPKVTVCYKP